jgi:hypothetical protein
MSHRFDGQAVPIADRHYNRQTIGAPQFVPPGRCVVFKTTCVRALWVSSWPFAEFTKHAWAGAWVNSTFRNEGAGLSSELIREAVAATLHEWPEPPALGMVTFVDAKKVRHKRDPGRCYIKAGFKRVGFTKGGLVALQLLPADMPRPMPAMGAQLALDAACASDRYPKKGQDPQGLGGAAIERGPKDAPNTCKNRSEDAPPSEP